MGEETLYRGATHGLCVMGEDWAPGYTDYLYGILIPDIRYTGVYYGIYRYTFLQYTVYAGPYKYELLLLITTSLK